MQITDLMQAIEHELPNILWEIDSCNEITRSNFEREYKLALFALGSGQPREGINKILDRHFIECRSEFAIIFDHIKECFNRGYVLSYHEYRELNARFPRSR